MVATITIIYFIKIEYYREWGEGKLDEGGQKAQNPRDAMYNTMIIANTAIWYIYESH